MISRSLTVLVVAGGLLASVVPAVADPLLFFCDRPIAGGSSSVTFNVSPSCSGCSVTNPTRGADLDESSYADLKVSNSAGLDLLALRARAQPGVVFPAGNVACARVGFSHTPDGTSSFLQLKTYLGGSLQESAIGPSASTATLGSAVQCFANGNTITDEANDCAFKTSKPFDAVELTVTPVGLAVETQVRVYELYGDGIDALPLN